MANEHTPEQVAAEHLDRLGTDLGPLYHAIWNEYGTLVLNWQEYREAFGTSPERVELLNTAAGFFFRLVQDAMWADTLLQLCRLTDPPSSVGRANLTLRRLPPAIAAPAVRAEVSALVDQAVAATEFARDWRNRHLGHRDLALALNQGVQPLSAASRLQVVDAIAAIHGVLNTISQRLMQSDLAAEVIPPPTGAVALMQLLREGIEAREARQERIRRGEHRQGDLGPRAV